MQSRAHDGSTRAANSDRYYKEQAVKRFITIDSIKYLIRGPYTATEVRNLYSSFLRKYPDSKLTLAQWAVQRGRVYLAVKS